ncbi:MAG: pilus assembly protein PilM [Verrucomicrobia bacterium]|nr:pilus assembly protein PilM [Verrucomicrobiota bacterium]
MNLFSLPPTRRLLVIDPGSRCIKVLLVNKLMGRVRVLRHRSFDLAEGSVLTPEELSRLLETVLQEFGRMPVAISLPQQLSISQVIDLPRVGPEQVKALIEEETVKLSGLSESGIVYDYGKLKPFGKYQNPFWVTFAKEEEILMEVSRLVGIGGHLCEIITPANALIATYQAAQPRPENALLVELGATSTVVAIVAQGQGVYALSYPIGGNTFTEAIATQQNCSLEAAKSLKYSQNLFAAGAAIPGLCSVVDGWRTELEKILQDWLRENPELGLSVDSFRIILGGGGARQPGLMEYLNAKSQLRFTPWPSLSGELGELTLERYAVAYGVALKRLGPSLPSASLFPADLREARKRQSTQALLQSVNWALLLVVALVLLFGTAQKFNLTQKKQALLKQSQAVLEEAKGVETLNRRLEDAYERLRPVLKLQKRTVDKLSTLALLQKVRDDKKLWFVLFADQESYFAGQAAPVTQTNLAVAAAALNVTNPPPSKYGFIAELCLSEEGEAMRETLRKVVSELKQNPAFTNVDTLPADQRKNLVSTNVLVAGRYFSLSIEMAENTFQNPLPPTEPKPPPIRTLKTNARTLHPALERNGTPAPAREN